MIQNASFRIDGPGQDSERPVTPAPLTHPVENWLAQNVARKQHTRTQLRGFECGDEGVLPRTEGLSQLGVAASTCLGETRAIPRVTPPAQPAADPRP